jgi:fatty acid-binding protein DegV
VKLRTLRFMTLLLASLAMGMCVLAAARLARAGATAEECAAAAESVARRLHIGVAFETLEYRGGRIGRAHPAACCASSPSSRSGTARPGP